MQESSKPPLLMCCKQMHVGHNQSESGRRQLATPGKQGTWAAHFVSHTTRTAVYSAVALTTAAAVVWASS
jgi:hypothetical protein